MKYKNFVFDLYGTLIDVFTDDDSPKTDEAMAAFFAEHGAPRRPEDRGGAAAVGVPYGQRLCADGGENLLSGNGCGKDL